MTGTNGGVSPLLATSFSGLLIGQRTVQLVSAVALGVSAEDALKVPVNDLMTIVKLWREQTEKTFIQIAEELA